MPIFFIFGAVLSSPQSLLFLSNPVYFSVVTHCEMFVYEFQGF